MPLSFGWLQTCFHPMSSCQSLVLVCVFLGLTYWSQDLQENIAWAPEAGVVGG